MVFEELSSHELVFEEKEKAEKVMNNIRKINKEPITLADMINFLSPDALNMFYHFGWGSVDDFKIIEVNSEGKTYYLLKFPDAHFVQ